MRVRSPAAVALASAVSLCFLAVACSGSGTKRLIPPPPQTIARLTTAPPGSDFTGVALAPVEGKLEAPPTAEVLGGNVVLTGLISGPDGPVAGATVRLERFVGDAMGRLDIVSNADGTWKAPQPPAPPPVPTIPTLTTTFPGQSTFAPTTLAPPPTTAPTTLATALPTGPQGILGGRYRIRAWRTPDLALTAPQILFVEAGQPPRNVALQLSRYTGTSVSSTSSPDQPTLDTITNVTAIVATASVDGDGVVRAVPLASATLSLSAGGSLAFSSGSGPSFTNAQGRATFQVRCQGLGQGTLDLTVNSLQSFSLPIKPCVAPPSTTTTTLFGDPGGGSSTTGSLPGGSTTSTRGATTTT